MIYQGKQKIWSDYQKEIPDDHWFYVRSCIRQSFFPASEFLVSIYLTCILNFFYGGTFNEQRYCEVVQC